MACSHGSPIWTNGARRDCPWWNASSPPQPISTLSRLWSTSQRLVVSIDITAAGSPLLLTPNKLNERSSKACNLLQVRSLSSPVRDRPLDSASRLSWPEGAGSEERGVGNVWFG